MTIDVPRRARAGTSTLRVTATSVTDPEVSATRAIEVEVRKGRP